MNSSAAADPRLLDLAERLAAFLAERGQPLPLPLVETLAVGMVERLNEFTTRHAPAGDIGRHSDRAIARAIGWTGFTDALEDAKWIVEQLVAFNILARDDSHRLIVCDWPQRCDTTCHQYVADHGIPFADGTRATRRARQNSPVGRRRRAEQLAVEEAIDRASLGLDRPLPMPKRQQPAPPGPASHDDPPPHLGPEDYHPPCSTVEQFQGPWPTGIEAGV